MILDSFGHIAQIIAWAILAPMIAGLVIYELWRGYKYVTRRRH